MSEELVAHVRKTAGEERRYPGAVLERWAELGRRAEAAGLTQSVDLAWFAKSETEGAND